MGAAQLNSIEESESEELLSEDEDFVYSDSKNSQADIKIETNESKVSKVIAADDQILNIQVLKSHFSELGLTKSVQFAFNGQQAIDLVKECFVTGLNSFRKTGDVFKPISLLILDF